MKSKKLFFFFSLILFLGLFSSCGSDGVDCGNSVNWASEINAELTAWTNAATAFSTNPTTENCNAYKDAYQDFIDALKPWGDCLSGQEFTDWQQDLNDAEAGVAAINC
jgi:hypothetical protein